MSSPRFEKLKSAQIDPPWLSTAVSIAVIVAAVAVEVLALTELARMSGSFLDVLTLERVLVLAIPMIPVAAALAWLGFAWTDASPIELDRATRTIRYPRVGGHATHAIGSIGLRVVPAKISQLNRRFINETRYTVERDLIDGWAVVVTPHDDRVFTHTSRARVDRAARALANVTGAPLV